MNNEAILRGVRVSSQSNVSRPGSKSGKTAILREVEIFSQLNRRQLARLAKLATLREFPVGTQILRHGDSGVALYVVVQGRVAVTLRSAETGTEWTLREIGPGGAFGEIALIDGGPRAADVTTLEPTECLLLTRWDFSGEMSQDPDIARALLPVLCAKIRGLQDQLLRYELEEGRGAPDAGAA